jgi:hypothetical protein
MQKRGEKMLFEVALEILVIVLHGATQPAI